MGPTNTSTVEGLCYGREREVGQAEAYLVDPVGLHGADAQREGEDKDFHGRGRAREREVCVKKKPNGGTEIGSAAFERIQRDEQRALGVDQQWYTLPSLESSGCSGRDIGDSNEGFPEDP